MPVESKKQLGAMAAAAQGKSNIGIPAKVGQEFLAATPKGAAKNLPTRVGKKSGKDYNFTKK